MTKLLNMNLFQVHSARALENKFNCLDIKFTERNTFLEMLSGIGVDNTNTNIRPQNAMKTQTIAKSRSSVSKLSMSLFHNVIRKASSAFSSIFLL